MMRRFYLFTAVFLLALLSFAFLFGREWRDWQDSPTWAMVMTETLTIQPKSSSVRYGYMVNGRFYEGDRTHFFVVARFQDRRVLDWINENRAETAVVVYYDSDAPNRAVLVREVDSAWVWQWPLICGVAGFVILLPLLVFGGLWRWLWRQFKL